MLSSNFDINSLSGHQFENLVETLIQKMGFITRERTTSADGGIDILAINPQPILEGSYIIQCKRYLKPVSVSVIRDLYGVVHSNNANKGILITNSTYTKPALDFAVNKQLELIDGEKLLQLLVKYGLLENNVDNIDSITPLRNSWRVYNHTIIQPLNKLIKEMEDYQNGLVFINKKEVNLSKWYNIVDTQSKNLVNYMKIMENLFLQMRPYMNTDASEDIQIIQKYAKYIIDSTKIFCDNYKEIYAINPPPQVKDLHTAFLNLYIAWLKDLAIYKTWFEETMTHPPKNGENTEISIGNEFNKAIDIWIQKREKINNVGPNWWWLVVWFLFIVICMMLGNR